MNIKLFKQIVFIALLILVLMAIIAAVSYQEYFVQYFVWILVGAVALLMIWKFDFIVLMKDYERAVIFRFGKVNRVGGPGWAVIFPPIESHRRVDLRTHTIDVPKQDVVTKDNVEVRIDAIIYIKVKSDRQSVINSVIEIRDYDYGARQFVIASVRDIAGSMTLPELISNIEYMNGTIKKRLLELIERWGVTCDAVEIKDVQIPKTVIEAMHLEKAAEQEKLARIEKAKAHQAEIEAVQLAAGQLSDRALSYYYIRALERLGEGKATKFILPMEITRLAETIAGRVPGASKGGDLDSMIKQYAPLIATYLKQEKELRKGGEKEEKKKPKKKK